MSTSKFRVAALVAIVLVVSAAAAERTNAFWQGHGIYEVTITNLTRDQRFTPFAVVTHNDRVQLFELGHPASAELSTLAEEGNTTPLLTALGGTTGVLDTAMSAGLLDPGASVTLEVLGGARFDSISLAAMLIPTNDGFVALNGVGLPKGREVTTVLAPAYDAGSERNDETCASIPGPFFDECGGPGTGGAPGGGEEGYVHIHAGIHGIGDLDESRRDWRNPVAKITVRRVK